MQRLREPRNAAIVGILLAALIVVIFLVARGGNDNSNSQPKPTGGAQQASQRQLEDLASSVNHPVYWAGARPGKLRTPVPCRAGAS